MITTLRLNFQDPYRRKAFYARFAGKMIGPVARSQGPALASNWALASPLQELK